VQRIVLARCSNPILVCYKYLLVQSQLQRIDRERKQPFTCVRLFCTQQPQPRPLAILTPPPHPDLAPQRLPQEPLPRLKLGLLQLELIPPEDRAHDQRQLHLRHIPPHTRPGPVAERDEGVLLLFRHGIPALGPEGVGVRAPDGRGVVDGVRGDGEDGVLREVVLVHGDAGTGWDEAGEAEGGGRVDAEGLVDDVVQACVRS